jgi:hypothetical protein
MLPLMSSCWLPPTQLPASAHTRVHPDLRPRLTPSLIPATALDAFLVRPLG